MIGMAVKDANDVQVQLGRRQFSAKHIILANQEPFPLFLFHRPAIGHWKNLDNDIDLLFHATQQQSTTLIWIRGHAMSVDPAELRRMVEACDRASVLRGGAEILVRESERPARDLARRSLTAISTLESGTVIEESMLLARRPGTGIQPFELPEVIGRKTARSIEAGDVITWSDLVEPDQSTATTYEV